MTLELDGKPKLQFAAAYGFRNIQNIVQKLKRGKCSYDFVEIMACPSGELPLSRSTNCLGSHESMAYAGDYGR